MIDARTAELVKAGREAMIDVMDDSRTSSI